eukprot:TRINITY_DN1402_c0_g1_i1.p1 TRINITY_DN1402_c0_g1~~TRINITY_DN1402_c0_g1_i1.p1  ORF type:complete len:406 (-),score=34.22 TRINITY_DN1402_c0_g1_i1:81-1298(-)
MRGKPGHVSRGQFGRPPTGRTFRNRNSSPIQKVGSNFDPSRSYSRGPSPRRGGFNPSQGRGGFNNRNRPSRSPSQDQITILGGHLPGQIPIIFSPFQSFPLGFDQGLRTQRAPSPRLGNTHAGFNAPSPRRETFFNEFNPSRGYSPGRASIPNGFPSRGPSPSRPEIQNSTTKVIYLRNLRPSLNERMLENALSRYGNVQRITLKRFLASDSRSSYESKYAIVELENSDQARRIMMSRTPEIEDLFIPGKQVYIAPYQSRNDRQPHDSSGPSLSRQNRFPSMPRLDNTLLIPSPSSYPPPPRVQDPINSISAALNGFQSRQPQAHEWNLMRLNTSRREFLLLAQSEKVAILKRIMFDLVEQVNGLGGTFELTQKLVDFQSTEEALECIDRRDILLRRINEFRAFV